jgi:hypothetical protein
MPNSIGPRHQGFTSSSQPNRSADTLRNTKQAQPFAGKTEPVQPEPIPLEPHGKQPRWHEPKNVTATTPVAPHWPVHLSDISAPIDPICHTGLLYMNGRYWHVNRQNDLVLDKNMPYLQAGNPEAKYTPDQEFRPDFIRTAPLTSKELKEVEQIQEIDTAVIKYGSANTESMIYAGEPRREDVYSHPELDMERKFTVGIEKAWGHKLEDNPPEKEYGGGLSEPPFGPLESPRTELHPW